MSGRVTSMSRFDETIPEPATTKLRCDYDCGEPIYVGDSVIVTYDNEVVHEDCWRDYCDEMYRWQRGYVDGDGNVA